MFGAWAASGISSAPAQIPVTGKNAPLLDNDDAVIATQPVTQPVDPPPVASVQTTPEPQPLVWLMAVVTVITIGVMLVLGVKSILDMAGAASQVRRPDNMGSDLSERQFEQATAATGFPGDNQAGFARTNKSKTFSGNHGYYYTGANELIDRYRLAMKLIRDAIDQVGVKSNYIPSAEQLGWPTRIWDKAVDILKPYGVEKMPGEELRAYLVAHYPTLKALYIVIGEKQMALSRELEHENWPVAPSQAMWPEVKNRKLS